MHMAAEAGHVEVVKLLVESGASPRAESQVSEGLFSNAHDGRLQFSCPCMATFTINSSQFKIIIDPPRGPWVDKLIELNLGKLYE